jgi:hypothetical protein
VPENGEDKMKKVMLVWLLLPVAALAQSAFDGTWKQRLDSIRITEKPEVFSIVNGTYICSSTKPEIKIMADGHDHTIMGDYTLAVTIVDAHTTRNTWKLAGKITDVTTSLRMDRQFTAPPRSTRAQNLPPSHTLRNGWPPARPGHTPYQVRGRR